VLSNVAWYRATTVLVGIDGRYGRWDEEGRPVGRSIVDVREGARCKVRIRTSPAAAVS
jgi:hypothetical protein